MFHSNAHNDTQSATYSATFFSSKEKRTIKFTDVSIRHLKAEAKTKIYWCSRFSGLGIRVTPKGTKTWFYYYRFSNNQRRLTLGRYPKTSLSKAISLHNDAKRNVEMGIDPFAEKQLEKKKKFEESTISELVGIYLEHSKKGGKKSYLIEKKCLYKDLLPSLGSSKITEVRPKDLSEIFHHIIVEREAPSTATHLYSYVRRLFNFASDMGLMQRRDNPCLDIKLRIKNKKRSRHLSMKEIYQFWYGLDKIVMAGITRLALKFMLVTLARGGEVRHMKWSDIDFNERIWTLPKTKNGHMHRIYLGCEALKILEEARQYSDGMGLVFGSTGKMVTCGIIKNNLKPMSGHTLCQPIKRHFDIFAMESPFIPHDLRRTGATIIAGLFGRQDLVKMCLNHVRSDVTDIYDQYTYREEKKKAMNALNDAIRFIINSANIESVPTFDELKDHVINPIVPHTQLNRGKQGLLANFSAPVTYRLSFGQDGLLDKV